MARETFKIEGLRELEEALTELPKATGRNVLKRALVKAGKPIETNAAALAPRGATGKLQMSVTTGTKLSRRQRKLHRKESPVEVFVGPGPHAKSVQQEFGNRNHGPQPYMRPSFDANVRRSLEIVKTELGNEIEKARKRLARKAEREASRMGGSGPSSGGGGSGGGSGSSPRARDSRGRFI